MHVQADQPDHDQGERQGGPEDAGPGIAWLGLALRIWSIVVLGCSFRMTVEVDTEQPVVTSGPYHWVRHPS